MTIKARLTADGYHLGLCDVQDHTTLIMHRGVVFVRDGANQFLMHKKAVIAGGKMIKPAVVVVNFDSTAIEAIEELEDL